MEVKRIAVDNRVGVGSWFGGRGVYESGKENACNLHQESNSVSQMLGQELSNNLDYGSKITFQVSSSLDF